jgi:hypothetical protein
MIIKVIHIGKCGGSTLRYILDKYAIKYELFHIAKPTFEENCKYVIIIRNPIDRIISAFNWRYKLVVLDKTQENRFAGEKNTLEKYKCINNFAEQIEHFDVSKTYIHHIYEDINFYLCDFLKNVKRENILGVITQENLIDDIKNIFNVCDDICDTRVKYNSGTNKYISETGYNLLKKYLYKDYECINKLFSLGLLSDQQYDVLSK